jgi:hypothetical protein
MGGLDIYKNKVPPDFDAEERAIVKKWPTVWSINHDDGSRELKYSDQPLTKDELKEASVVFKGAPGSADWKSKKYVYVPKLDDVNHTGPVDVRQMFGQNAQPPLDTTDFNAARNVYIDKRGQTHFSDQKMDQKTADDALVIYKMAPEEGVSFDPSKMYNPNARDPQLRALMRTMPAPPSSHDMSKAVAVRGKSDVTMAQFETSSEGARNMHAPADAPKAPPGKKVGETLLYVERKDDKGQPVTDKLTKKPVYDFASATVYERPNGSRIAIADPVDPGKDGKSPGAWAAEHLSGTKDHKATGPKAPKPKGPHGQHSQHH